MKRLFSGIILLTVTCFSLSAFAESFIQFVVVGKVWPEHKWGHLSLRISNSIRDEVYDFGRYGAMWGPWNTQGEPILRVWTNARAHLIAQKDGNPRIDIVTVTATESEANAAFHYFDKLTGSLSPRSKNAHHAEYRLRIADFHAINNNCVTMSMNAFYAAQPHYQGLGPRYARGDDLYFWARPKANNISYIKSQGRWNHLWWPKDTLNFLKAEILAKRRGFAEVY